VLQTTRVAGSASAPTIAAGPFVMVDPMPTPPEALQPNSTLLDTGDGHFASLVQVGASIWGVHSATSDAGRAAIRWFEFDASDATALQSGVIDHPDRDFLYPSIAVNPSGAVVIGFSASGTSLMPSAFAVLGETVAGVTTFGEPILVRAGSASFSASRVRFGDYSATVLDPSDDTRFWTFQEIGAPSNAGAVAVASLRVVPEPDAPSAALIGSLALRALAAVRARNCGRTRRRSTLRASA
jgi:hypothetical protein